jgi:hypothetical protein
MKVVVFTKKGTVNGKEYKRGAVLRVSSSIFNRLVNEEGRAKEKVDEPQRSSTGD